MTDFQRLRAADIMKKALVSVRPNQTLLEVERTFVNHHITGVPVVEAGHLRGVISRSDITRVRELTRELDGQVSDEVHWEDTQADGFQHNEHSDFHGFEQRFANFKAQDVMRSQVVTCSPDTLVVDVAAQMVRHHIHRVIVVEGDHPVGIVSALDVTALVAGLGSASGPGASKSAT